MKVVLLAPASVVHTQRWVDGLAGRGLEIVVATQHAEPTAWRAPPGVRIEPLPHTGGRGYLRNVPALRRLLRAEKPDLLHAHYASGYGTLAALAGFRPWLLSVWGSDVYDFPYQGRLKGWLLRRNLRQADAIASTSHAMAAQVRRLWPAAPPVAITPFGIDTTRFASLPARAHHAGFVIGTVKTLEPKYGVDVLVRAFARFVDALPDRERSGVELVLVGGGGERAALEALSRQLGVDAQTRFVGAVAHAEVPDRLRGFDVYVAASRLDSESFGVAVLEASACGVPVVVSDAGGLPEVVLDGNTGLVVPRDDVDALAAALRRLFDSAELRRRLGGNGRRHVIEHYEWSHSIDRMLDVYATLVPAAAEASRSRSAPAACRAAAPVPTAAQDMAPAAARAEADRVVSVIVPCRNERAYIEAFCASVWQQVLPAGWRLQLIVADGLSSDGTAALLRQLAAADSRLHVIDNPRRIVSTGLNLALTLAHGEVVVRMDVHSEYAADYAAECIAALARSGADNVGGPWRAVPDAGAGPMQHAVAAAFQSPAIAGGALSRRLDHEGPADTVYLGAWPRATFERFGGFDEGLVRNQDDEHNLRIVQGGGRVWQSKLIRSVYRPRARLAQVARQYLQYGYWKPFVMKKHGQPAALRHLVPALFVAALLLSTFAALTGVWQPAVWLVGAYAAAVVAMSTGVWLTARPRWPVLARIPAVIATYHLAYGVGSLCGWWDVTLRGSARPGFGTLTR